MSSPPSHPNQDLIPIFNDQLIVYATKADIGLRMFPHIGRSSICKGLRGIGLWGILGLASACGVYVPPVWDIGDAIDKVERIEPNVTSKATVLTTLGQPVAEVDNIFVYEGRWSSGFVVFSGLGPGAQKGFNEPRASLIGESSWSILVGFDPNDTVGWITTHSVRKGGDTYVLSGYAWYLRQALCGDANAQDIVGQILNRSDGRGRYLLEAYRWFRLATIRATETWHTTHARQSLGDVSKRLTTEEITEVERSITNWKPDTTACKSDPS